MGSLKVAESGPNAKDELFQRRIINIRLLMTSGRQAKNWAVS